MKTGFLCPGVSSFIQAKPKVLYTTYYKNSNLVLVDWAFRAVLKISAVLLKYPIFEGVLFHILIGKQIQTYSRVHISSGSLFSKILKKTSIVQKI